MAKVIYIDDDGNSKVLKEGSINEYDVLFRSDYLAVKLWCEEDISVRMSNRGYDVTPEKIADVLNGDDWSWLGDCTDDDWYCIDDRIYDVLGAPDHSPDELSEVD